MNTLWIDKRDLTLLIIFFIGITFFCLKMYNKDSVKEYIKNFVKQNKILSVFLAWTLLISIKSFLQDIYNGESFEGSLVSGIILLAGYWSILIFLGKWIANGGIAKLLADKNQQNNENEVKNQKEN